MFYFIFLVCHQISELRWPIVMKLCHIIAIWLNFIMQVQNSGGPPLTNFGANNMPNLGRFYTTSDFDREYLRNETRYPKSERLVMENDSSRFRRNKSGELWSTIQKIGHVSLDPPKSTFSRDYISAPKGAGPRNVYRR